MKKEVVLIEEELEGKVKPNSSMVWMSRRRRGQRKGGETRATLGMNKQQAIGPLPQRKRTWADCASLAQSGRQALCHGAGSIVTAVTGAHQSNSPISWRIGEFL